MAARIRPARSYCRNSGGSPFIILPKRLAPKPLENVFIIFFIWRYCLRRRLISCTLVPDPLAMRFFREPLMSCGYGPVAFGPDEKKAYVVDTQTNDITVVDLETGQRIVNIDGGSGTKEVIPLPDAGLIAAISDERIDLIDTARDGVREAIPMKGSVETRAESCVGFQLQWQYFDRYAALKSSITSAINLAHSSDSDTLDDLVRTETATGFELHGRGKDTPGPSDWRISAEARFASSRRRSVPKRLSGYSAS